MQKGMMKNLQGTCRHCGEKAGRMQHVHPECEEQYQETLQQMTQLAAQVAGTLNFGEKALLDVLAGPASRYPGDPGMALRAMEKGWTRAVRDSVSEKPSSREGEETLRRHRERSKAESGHLDHGSPESPDPDPPARLMLQARAVAAAHSREADLLDPLHDTARSAGLDLQDRQEVLVQAWESAVHGSLEAEPITSDQENALVRYRERFGLSVADLDRSGVHTAMIKSAAIREVIRGNTPARQNLDGQQHDTPRSETAVWVFENALCNQEVGHGPEPAPHPILTLRTGDGIYHRPAAFRRGPAGPPPEGDQGTLMLTDKGAHFTGESGKVRIPYGKIARVDLRHDGAVVTLDDQKSSPVGLITGDGWFICNMLDNLKRAGA